MIKNQLYAYQRLIAAHKIPVTNSKVIKYVRFESNVYRTKVSLFTVKNESSAQTVTYTFGIHAGGMFVPIGYGSALAVGAATTFAIVFRVFNPESIYFECITDANTALITLGLHGTQKLIKPIN